MWENLIGLKDIISGAWRFVRWVASPIRKAWRHRRFQSERNILEAYEHFVVESCDDSKIRQVFRVGSEFFREATGMTEEQVINRYKHNPQAFKCVMRLDEHTKTKTLVGYFVLLPITKQCVEAIAQRHIEAGRHIRDTDIARNFSNYEALYISVVYGKSPRAQVFTAQALRDAILDCKRRHPKLRYVFVRPTTEIGRHSFRSHTSKDCPPDGKIRRVDLYEQDLAVIDSHRRLPPRKKQLKKGK